MTETTTDIILPILSVRCRLHKKTRALGHDGEKNNQVSFVFCDTDHPQSLKTLMITEYIPIRKGKKMALDLVAEELRVPFRGKVSV
jgi:hypothetical protein